MKKIILSRKGFDSVYGEVASPIMPDGTLLSLPIPGENDELSYSEISYNGVPYSEIIKQLKPNFGKSFCHLDPDIFEDLKEREHDWKACFGQSDAAFTHLENQRIDVGDVFLFFGWFRETEYDLNNQLRYKKSAQDIHVLYGYFEIGEVHKTYDEIEKFRWHTHARNKLMNKKLNALYVRSDKLLGSQYPGFGTFKFSKELVLTKEGMTRTRWILPDCLMNKSFHITI